MATRKIATITTLILFTAAAPVAGQSLGDVFEPDPQLEGTRVGSRAANFLKLGVSARALSLGGAYTAMSDDIYSLYWNAAGLANVNEFSVAYSYTALFEDADITRQFTGLAMPLFGGVVGLSGIFFDSGPITRTTYRFPQGGDPTFGRTFSWTGSAIGLHYGRFITDRLSIGVAGKIISEGLASAQATFYAMDAGIRFDTGIWGTTIGAALTNVGPSAALDGPLVDRQIDGAQSELGALRTLDVDLETSPFQLPAAFHFGIRTGLVGGPTAIIAPSTDHRLVALVQFDDAIDSAVQPSIGFEYAFHELFFLRAGKKMVNSARDDAFRDAFYHGAAGAGLRLPLGDQRLGIDYAYMDMGELQNIQVLSFDFSF